MKKSLSLSYKLRLRLENGCLLLMATSAPAGSFCNSNSNNNRYNSNNSNNNKNIEETERQLRVPYLSLAKIDGQILSGRSDSCNCQACGMWQVDDLQLTLNTYLPKLNCRADNKCT